MVFAFIGRTGALRLDGQPVALAAVPARDRRARAMTQEELLPALGVLAFGPGGRPRAKSPGAASRTTGRWSGRCCHRPRRPRCGSQPKLDAVPGVTEKREWSGGSIRPTTSSGYSHRARVTTGGLLKRRSLYRRVLLVAVGLACGALAVSVVFAAAGKPGNFRLAATSPEAVGGDRVDLPVAAQLDDKPGVDLAVINRTTESRCCRVEGTATSRSSAAEPSTSRASKRRYGRSRLLISTGRRVSTWRYRWGMARPWLRSSSTTAVAASAPLNMWIALVCTSPVRMSTATAIPTSQRAEGSCSTTGPASSPPGIRSRDALDTPGR